MSDSFCSRSSDDKAMVNLIDKMACTTMPTMADASTSRWSRYVRHSETTRMRVTGRSRSGRTSNSTVFLSPPRRRRTSTPMSTKAVNAVIGHRSSPMRNGQTPVVRYRGTRSARTAGEQRDLERGDGQVVVDEHQRLARRHVLRRRPPRAGHDVADHRQTEGDAQREPRREEPRARHDDEHGEPGRPPPAASAATGDVDQRQRQPERDHAGSERAHHLLATVAPTSGGGGPTWPRQLTTRRL